MLDVTQEKIDKVLELTSEIEGLSTRINSSFDGIKQMRKKMCLTQGKKEVMFEEAEALSMYTKGLLDTKNFKKVEAQFPKLMEIKKEYLEKEKEYQIFVKKEFGYDPIAMSFSSIMMLILQVTKFVQNENK